MTLVLKDRVKEQTTTTGTGSVTLGGAVSGFEAFSAVGDGNTTYYAIVHQTADEWEVGLGTYTAAGTLLSRDTILESSNSDAAVVFSAGTKDVFVTYPADKSIYRDAAGTVNIDSLRLVAGVTVTSILDEDNMASNSATALSTQQSIKAYVDAQVGTADTLSEVLALGNTTGGTDIAMTGGDKITNFESTGINDDAVSTALTINSSGDVTVGGDVTVENGVPILTLRSTSATGRSDIQFGDPASVGVGRLSYNHNGDYLSFNIAGAEKFRMNTSQLLALNAAGPALLNEAASSTNPTLIPNRAEPDTGIGWASADTLTAVTGGSERMRIDSSGNVGIGTSSPTTRLSFGNYIPSNGQTIHTYQDGNSVSGLGIVAGMHRMFTSSGADLSYGHVSSSDGSTYTERMRITSAGNVGIGTSSPGNSRLAVLNGGAQAVLSVRDSANGRVQIGTTDYGVSNSSAADLQITNQALSGTVGMTFNVGDATNSGNIYWRSNTTNNAVQIVGNPGNNYLAFATSSAEKMRIDSSGNVGIGTSTLNGTLLVINQNGEDAPSSSGNMTTGSFLGAVSVGGAALNIGHDADGTWYNSAYFNNAGVARIHRWLTGGAERMRIDSSGNLTMAATQGPALMNEDASNTNPTLIPRKTDTGTGWGSNGANNLEGIVGSVRSVLFGAGTTAFYASGGSEVARIDRSSGNVGIGTTVPDSAVTAYKSADALDGISIRQNSAGASAGARLKLGNNSDARDAEIVLTGSGNSSYAGARTLNFVSNVGGFGFYRGYTTPVATMVLDSSGNVGIGTSSPATFTNGLAVAGSGNDGDVAVINNTAGAWSFKKVRSDNSNAMGIYDPTGFGAMALYTAGAERMRIDSGGNVGIRQTPNAGYTLSVNGNIGGPNAAFAIYPSPGVSAKRTFSGSNNANATLHIDHEGGYNRFGCDSTSQHFAFCAGGSTAGDINVVFKGDGNVGIGTASPSYLTHLYSTTADPKLVIEDASNGAGRGGIVTGTWGGNGIRLDSLGAAGWVYVGGGNTSYIPFTIGTEKARFHNNGNFGLGTTAPAKQLHITKAAIADIGTLTDGATITPDFDANQNFTVTLGGNRTLANPTNVDAGQTGSIFVVQDATGGRTLSFGSYWKFAGGTAPTLSTGANAVDRIDYIVKSSTEIHAVASLNLS